MEAYGAYGNVWITYGNRCSMRQAVVKGRNLVELSVRMAQFTGFAYTWKH